MTSKHMLRVGVLLILGCAESSPGSDAGMDALSAPDSIIGADSDATDALDSGVSDDGGANDSAAPDSAADSGPPFVPGEPIEVTERDAWAWVPMESMTCADGTPGGFGVNFTDASRELVVYFLGGGVCHNALTCNASLIANVGTDPINLVSGLNHGIFDRDNPDNPFRNANFVVLPHCTGDHHTGDSVQMYGDRMVHHHGYANVSRLTERIVPTFSDASRITLTGFSAGGVGISANYHQIARGFDSVDAPTPLLIIDAGPFLRPAYLKPSAQAALRESWNLDATIGTFCPECLESGFHLLYSKNYELHPDIRASLVCSYDDSVVKVMYFAIGAGLVGLHEGLLDLASALEPESFMKFFYYPGDRHGALHLNYTDTSGLQTFLNAQVSGTGWESVTP